MHILSLLFMFLLTHCFAADCIWDPSMWKRNCLQYCLYTYGKAPQRAYYNQTSQNCQPLRKCVYRLPPQKPFYYKYDQNRCYESETNLTEVDSFRPLAVKIQSFIPVAGQNMNCIHGRKVKIYSTVGSKFVCQCESLWQHSGKYDMNGVPFKCDTPITDLVGYFVGSIEYDAEGNRVKFGKFTPQQIRIALQNLKEIQKQETRAYVLTHQQSIFYAINKAFESDSDQILDYFTAVPSQFTIGIGVFFYVVIIISYIEDRFNIIYITKQQLIQKIIEAIEQESHALKVRSS